MLDSNRSREGPSQSRWGGVPLATPHFSHCRVDRLYGLHGGDEAIALTTKNLWGRRPHTCLALTILCNSIMNPVLSLGIRFNLDASKLASCVDVDCILCRQTDEYEVCDIQFTVHCCSFTYLANLIFDRLKNSRPFCNAIYNVKHKMCHYASEKTCIVSASKCTKNRALPWPHSWIRRGKGGEGHRSRIRYLSKKNSRILTNFLKLKKFVKIRTKIR